VVKFKPGKEMREAVMKLSPQQITHDGGKPQKPQA
jgi:hypothetical protein